jgi:L-amino acid N-acyltransferase YncA
MTDTSTVTVRPATLDRLPAVAEIAAHHVQRTVTTFQTEPLALGGWEDRWGRCAPRAARSSSVGSWRERPAYAATGEDSIYLAPGREGRGLGRALLAALLTEAEAAGVRELVAVVSDAGSPASVAPHEKLGFRQVGRLERVGFKQGRWLDTVLLQRSLG